MIRWDYLPIAGFQKLELLRPADRMLVNPSTRLDMLRPAKLAEGVLTGFRFAPTGIELIVCPYVPREEAWLLRRDGGITRFVGPTAKPLSKRANRRAVVRRGLLARIRQRRPTGVLVAATHA